MIGLICIGGYSLIVETNWIFTYVSTEVEVRIFVTQIELKCSYSLLPHEIEVLAICAPITDSYRFKKMYGSVHSVNILWAYDCATSRSFLFSQKIKKNDRSHIKHIIRIDQHLKSGKIIGISNDGLGIIINWFL